MSYVTSSYLDNHISTRERIYRIWFVNFAFRMWRRWILSDNSYSLQNNFISPNAYLCNEVNAHASILIPLTLKKHGQQYLYKPSNFGSQSCESYFRTNRSYSTSESTQVNFTLFEFLNSRAPKLDASMRLTADGVRDGLKYPRHKRPFDDMSLDPEFNVQDGDSDYFPSANEIEETVLRAMQDVENEFMNLGNDNFYNIS